MIEAVFVSDVEFLSVSLFELRDSKFRCELATSMSPDDILCQLAREAAKSKTVRYSEMVFLSRAICTTSKTNKASGVELIGVLIFVSPQRTHAARRGRPSSRFIGCYKARSAPPHRDKRRRVWNFC